MTLFQSPHLEPTINIGINETHAEDQHKHYETGMHKKETRLHRMIEGKNQKASHKANFVPHHQHSPSTSRFQRASRFASEKHLPKELTLDSNCVPARPSQESFLPPLSKILQQCKMLLLSLHRQLHPNHPWAANFSSRGLTENNGMVAFLCTFPSQLFKPFLAATPLGGVETLQRAISPRHLLFRVLPLDTMENCPYSLHLPAKDPRTSWLLTSPEQRIPTLSSQHLRATSQAPPQTMNSPAATSSDSAATDTSCCQRRLQWPSLADLGSAPATKFASVALAETLKSNSHSTSPDPMKTTQSSINATSQWHSWHHGHQHSC